MSIYIKFSKRLVFVLIFSIIVNLLPVNWLSVKAEDIVTEYVSNGDFEKYPTAGVTGIAKGKSGKMADSDNWYYYFAEGGSGTTMNFQVVQEGRNGGYAMKISRTAAGTDNARGVIHKYVNGNSLAVGKTYKISAWVKFVPGEENEAYNNSNAYTNLAWFKKENGSYVRKGATKNITFSAAGEEWKKHSYIFVAEETEYYKFEIHAGKIQNGYYLIDDVEIVELTEPTVFVEPATAEIKVGDNATLTATVTDPDGLAEETVTWSSDNEAVATVTTEGVVTGVSAGTANITATVNRTDGGTAITATCAVTVTAAEPEPTVTNLIVNGSFEEDPDGAVSTTSGSSGKIADTKWRYWSQSGAMDYQVVQEGMDGSYAMKIARSTAGTSTGTRGVLIQYVSGLTIGETYEISGYARFVPGEDEGTYDNSAAYTNITVNKIVNGSSKKVGATTNVTFASAGDAWKKHTYTFTAEEVQYGFEINAAKSQSGYFLIDDVTLVRIPKDPTLVVTPESIELEVGEETTISAEVVLDPDDVLTDAGSIQWSIADPSVATLDADGKVTAKAIGKTTITVTAVNGTLAATCDVTVKEKTVPLTAIAMKETSAELYVGNQKAMEVVFTPDNATDKNLIWESTDATVAAVDENGLVTAWKAGEATITAKAGTLTATCIVTVKESTKLVVDNAKAQFTTPYGTTLTESLAAAVTNNTGSDTITYKLLAAPEKGTLKLETDGSFTYIPKGFDDAGHIDSFTVEVAAGGEATVLSGQITVRALSEDIASKLTGTSTLLITREELAEIKAELQDESSLRYKIWKQYEPYLKGLLNATPPEDSNPECGADCSTDPSYESLWQREVADTIAHLLWGYLLTDNETDREAYKLKCLEFTMASVGYKHWGSPTWHKEGALAAGHQAYAIGLVYNWMHDELTDDQAEKIVQKLYYTCGQFVKKNKNTTQYQQNHMWINITGLNAASLAIYIHAEDVAAILNDGTTADMVRANCVDWQELVYEKIGKSFEWAPKDGASHEGAGYYTYGVEWLLKSALLMRNNLGIDLITDNEWFAGNSQYFLNVMYPKNHITSNGNMIDYADGTRGSWYGPSHIFRILAHLYQDETAQWIAETYENANADASQSSTWFGLLFADSSVQANLDTTASKLYYADDLGIVTARTNWSGNESLVFLRSGLPLGKTGLELLNPKYGATNEYHVDPDCNAIILYSNGEYLLRTDGYAKQKKTANYSTLLVGGSGQIGGNDGAQGLIGHKFQELGLEPEIKVATTGEGYSYFVGDSTEAYLPDTGLKKFERNVVLIEEENVLLVVDNIKTSQNKDLELRWFPGSKNVTESYGIYTVNGTNNTMKFYPFTEETTTAFKDVDVYLTTAANQKEKAFVQTYSGLDWQNAAAFSWSADGESQTHVRYAKGNANEHKFEVNGKVYTINVAENTVTVAEGTLNLAPEAWLSDSSLSTILLNGFDLEGFDNAVTEYTVERFWKTNELTIVPVPNSPGATVEVTWDGNCPGVVTITSASGDNSSTSEFQINLKNDNGLLSIASATAVPNVAGISTVYTYDSYIQESGTDRTWSSVNLPVVTFDMGRVVDINKIDVAFNSSKNRSTFYDLLISEDGTTWEEVAMDQESARTTEQARSAYVTIYDGEALRAQYVKINLRSNTEYGKDVASAYNSIQEISIYGAEVVPVKPEIDASATDTSYSIGSDKTVTITSTGEFAKFESVEMDNVEVEKSNYTVKEGSTIVIFKTEYLETLSAGKHTVTINYKDGDSVESELTILAKVNDTDTNTDSDNDTDDDVATDDSNHDTNNAQTSEAETVTAVSAGAPTGDSSNLVLWFVLMVICVLGAGAAVFTVKRKMN